MESTRKDLEGPPIYPKAYHYFEHCITVFYMYLDVYSTHCKYHRTIWGNRYPVEVGTDFPKWYDDNVSLFYEYNRFVPY
jgi:hypothetical protein